ncbi:hypothetical protein [Teichococcus cervicalis]|uniref:Uncharacterized protein n=2 Tax=Teichococcus cervicalis TaxID=204525 RepID=D5RSW7_9PROT|nr:hypothetical protein [Pseudoroseomonas cervicalis]EFH09603.1 hypothetical protein HMPREF0731_4179 [Pseudoroseomonas cervicalis ATCC 49957]
MSPTRIFFLVFSAIIALLGLLQAGLSQDGPLTLFSLCLFAFGVGFALFLVKLTYDEAEEAGH